MITLPPDAPFSPAQKMWLKGFFDALAPNSASTSAPAPAETKAELTLLVGSQTGTGETIAKKLSKSLSRDGYQPKVTNMDQTSVSDLTGTENLVIITSTYGDGEAPDNAVDLYASLMAEDAPQFEKTRYTVLALGDSSYPDFCKCGKDFDQRLEQLGATRFADRLDCDVDYDNEVKSLESAIKANL